MTWSAGPRSSEWSLGTGKVAVTHVQPCRFTPEKRSPAKDFGDTIRGTDRSKDNKVPAGLVAQSKFFVFCVRISSFLL